MPDPSQRIGVVAAVESERIVVEIDASTSGFVKAGTAGVLPIGAINSYLIVPAGSTRVVAVVTAMRMAAASSAAKEPGFSDPTASVSRLLEATMVGRLEGGHYEPGLTSYPSIFAPVSAATRSDLEAIFRPDGDSLRFGEAVVAPDQDVWLHADKLLGRHFAVLGTTGSGKSCSVTAILDGLLEIGLPDANVLIIDTNGEYAACFHESTERSKRAQAFTMGPEPGHATGLFLPHWFMNTDEHLELLRASEGVQAPLLQRAIADARVASQQAGDSLHRLRVLRSAFTTVDEVQHDKKPQEKVLKQLKSICERLDTYIAEPCPLIDTWTAMRQEVKTANELHLDADSWDRLNAGQLDVLQRVLEKARESLKKGLDALGLGSATAAQDFDAPSYYSLEDLSDVFLPGRIDLESQSDQRIAAYAVTMQLRLNRLLADDRYSFMTRVAPFGDALARYLRLLFGKAPLVDVDPTTPPPWSDLYADAGGEESGHTVTILDLSLVSHDVLNVVTALVARLVLDLSQRLEPRAHIPVLVLLEEAHRYIHRDAAGTRSQSSVIFERIAKEGRKFGVSLGLASQRPSELDPTVLSQCGTIIAHRTVGQVDQDLIRAATPLASRDVLRQLPGLATGHAVVLGEAVPAPVMVKVRHVAEPPDSRDPSFVERWKSADRLADAAVLDEVAAAWEAGSRRRIAARPPSTIDSTDVAE